MIPTNPTRPLYLAAALLTVTGAALRLTPVGQPSIDAHALSGARQGDGSSGMPVETAAGMIDTTSTDPIVKANIFARERVAPSRAGAEPVHTISRPAAPAEPRFTLAGTTSGPQGSVALINGAVRHLGDTIDGARLVALPTPR